GFTGIAAQKLGQNANSRRDESGDTSQNGPRRELHPPPRMRVADPEYFKIQDASSYDRVQIAPVFPSGVRALDDVVVRPPERFARGAHGAAFHALPGVGPQPPSDQGKAPRRGPFHLRVDARGALPHIPPDHTSSPAVGGLPLRD